jgi:5,10-methylenetetrahydromethanopterin reductase
MRIGIFYGGPGDLDGQLRSIIDYEREGFDGVWMGQIHQTDVLTVLAIAGQKTGRLELGTSIVPVYPRHPVAMAQQALTVQAAAGGRFTLGLGLSHKPVVEGAWGLSYERPAAYMREYLGVLLPLLREGQATFRGEFFRVAQPVRIPVPKPPGVLIAALAPAMLRLAGEVADGTITWMVGRKTLESHVLPRIRRAAEAAGRAQPRIVVGLPIAVWDDAAEAREKAARSLQVYGSLANYRRVLDIEGAAGPADVAIVGNEKEVEEQLRALAAAGADDFLAGMFTVGEDAQASLDRTRGLLRGLVGKI